MTMVASSMAPMAMHSPASENRLMVWPKAESGSTVKSVLSSRMAIGPTDERKLPRKSTVTRISTISSETSVAKNCFSVAQIQAERS